MVGVGCGFCRLYALVLKGGTSLRSPLLPLCCCHIAAQLLPCACTETSLVRAADGGLKYNWSNVCMHYFQRAFLERMARQLISDGRYHIADKKIPSKDGPVQVRKGCTAPSWNRRG